MKSAIGVYESNEKALEALRELLKAGFTKDKLSIIAKASLIDNHIHVKTNDTIEKAEISIGVVAGTVLGVLAGIGVFVIPGGFLVGAGALVGAFAGLDTGLITGGLTAVLTSIGINELSSVKYEKHLNEGRFIIFVQGNDKQIEQAQKVLHMQGHSLLLSSEDTGELGNTGSAGNLFMTE